MKQSAPTPKDTSPDLELLRKVGERTIKRLEQEFGVKLKKPKPQAEESKEPQDESNQDG